jgi:rfaE bifunctional protein kinase chain/domain
MNVLRGPDLAHLLERLAAVRIAVLGDICLDAYLLLDPERSEISLETGLPTRAVREQRYTLGGGGNVAANCAAIGVGAVYVVGVVGRDHYALTLRAALEQRGIRHEGLLTQETEWSTHVFTKMFLDGAEHERLDFGNYNCLSPATCDALLARIETFLPELDVVIINQQVPWGVHSPRLRDGLVDLLGRHPRMLFVTDSRQYNQVYERTIHKLNEREALDLCGLPASVPGEAADRARRAGVELARRWGQPVVLTRGKDGCLVIDGQNVQEIPGMHILSPVDSVGAGDSFLAGLCAALGAGAPLDVAAQLGNYVAAVTVTRLQATGTATPEEVLAVGSNPDFRRRPDLAADPRKARRVQGTDIEVVESPPATLRLVHAVFDHDGTLSTLRQGWERIMEPMMVRAVLGDRFGAVEPGRLARVRELVQAYVDRTTGVQTLAQMRGLVDLVREHGAVPPEEILDEHGYKEIYNREILELVQARLDQLRSGRLDRTDLTVKGAAGFLRVLADRGVTLWLASGTDQGDAEAEARALGYGDLFRGRIYGAVGDLSTEPKRVVLKRILGEIGDVPASVVTFGDGPVELRETVKAGGYAVGVACDEIRRWGWDLRKRRRLIEAGAGLVIPDFSVASPLLDLLGLGGRP